MIFNKNCIDVMKNIETETIDLIVTDPPYKTTKRGNSGNTGGMLKTKMFMEGKVFKENDIKPEEYMPEFFRILKEDSHCYVMTNHVNLQNMINTATEVGFKFVKCLIWNKGNKIMGHYYMSQFEYILFLRKPKGKKINNCGTSDILSISNKKDKDENGKNLHDTQKPVELMKILVENSSQKGDIVLDPFMGIGSTGIACIECERNFIGIELDSHYFEIAERRLEEAKNIIKN